MGRYCVGGRLLFCRVYGSRAGTPCAAAAARGSSRPESVRAYVQLVNSVLHSPVDVVPPHLVRILQVELPRTQEAQQVDIVPTHV